MTSSNYERFDAFTGLTILEKSKLVDFLFANTENGHFSRNEITEAVECAVKERASLGGFILTLEKNGELAGAIVVNRTDSERVNRLSFLAIARPHRHNGVAKKLVAQAIEKSGGGLTLQIEPGNGEEDFFKKLGFERKYVVMQST
jgi:hypothetical protein